MAVLMVLLGTAACSGSERPHVRKGTSYRAAATWRVPTVTVATVPLARVTPLVSDECQRTADAIGYAVPCPTLLPIGMTPTTAQPHCSFAIVTFVDSAQCPGDPQARGWFFGTSGVNEPGSGAASVQHLVLWGSPHIERRPARAVDGPAVHPGRVLPRGSILIGGILRRWYLVPLDNPSAFRGHLVLIWTAVGHTYVYGYHVSYTYAMARALDLQLVRHLQIVGPEGAK